MERLRNIGGAHCMVFRRNYEEFEGTVTVDRSPGSDMVRSGLGGLSAYAGRSTV
jgi:hypothetical protein